MKYMLVGLIALLMTLAIPSYGQDSPEVVDDAEVTSDGPPPIQPDEVIPPEEKLEPFTRVMYVLDVSESMVGVLPEAIRATDVFMTDGFQATAVTFNSGFLRWDGVSEPCKHSPDRRCDHHCLPAGWCWMPKHRKELVEYLGSFVGNGGTEPAGAVEYALKAAPAECLIVFISDGGFVSQPVLDAVGRGMRWRAKHLRAPVQILVWSTVEEADAQISLVELARVGGGGLWRAMPPEPTPAPESESTPQPLAGE